jgi:ADP-heptose:LPS heptosyltransferase
VVVAVHPGSGSRAKNWAADRFAALVQRLHRSCGARSLVVAGPADKHAVGEMQRALAGVECIPAYDLPLPLLAALLARCQAYVGNDSGPTHLAAALGVPTVAIFGPTDPDLWAPREPSVQVVRGSAPCAPCSRQQRQACDSSACLQAVPVRAVVDRLQRLCPLVRPPDAETA